MADKAKRGGGQYKKGSREKGVPTWIIISAGIVLFVLIVYIGFAGKGTDPSKESASEMGPSAGSGGASPLVAAGAPEGVQLFENEGQEHVAAGTRVTYKSTPPTSGPHYARWAAPSVYEEGEVQPELLVHNLEHGNVIIYFDRSALAQGEVEELINLQKKFIGQWDGVLLVGQKNKETPVILTAWRVMLPLKGYDRERISQFLNAYRGRGPENPVR